MRVDEIEAEFLKEWQAPLELQKIGETDVAIFLQKWPKKFRLEHVDGQVVVELV